MAKRSPAQLAAALDKARADMPAEPPPLPPAVPKKNTCTLTLEDFLDVARPLQVKINDAAVVADVKEFSTGSFGWFVSGKVFVELPDGRRVQVQVGCNLICVGSKEAPRA